MRWHPLTHAAPGGSYAVLEDFEEDYRYCVEGTAADRLTVDRVRAVLDGFLHNYAELDPDRIKVRGGGSRARPPNTDPPWNGPPRLQRWPPAWTGIPCSGPPAPGATSAAARRARLPPGGPLPGPGPPCRR